MTSYLQNYVTNLFDTISDPWGRKETRDKLIFDTMANSLSSGGIGGTQLYGVILMIEAQGIVQPAGTTVQSTPNPTHPYVVSARIRPLGVAGGAFGLEEPCKYKNDPVSLYENLMQHPIGYSDALDGDETLFIPTVGDVVPIYYDIEGPSTLGKQRGLRFKMQRVRRAEGGFDQACLQALGAKMADGKISLDSIGNPGGTIVQGGAGGGFAGTGTGIGGGGAAGFSAGAGAISAAWPSGIVGVEVKDKEAVLNNKEHKPSTNAWAAALKARKFWMNPATNPSYPKVRHSQMGRKSATVGKPNIITLVDGTLPGKRKNCWTYDITNPGSPKLLVYTYAGIGFSSFKPGMPSGMKGSSSRKPDDFANGNSHTSAGMKVFGRFRTYHSMSRAKGAIEIYGLTPWNGNEVARGAIGHETGGKGRAFNSTTGPRESRSRPRSAGCISTAFTVHYSARELWKGGSWQYTWIGHEAYSIQNANINHWINMSGAKYHSGEKRQTWNWGAANGGHSLPPPRPRKKKKKKKKKKK